MKTMNLIGLGAKVNYILCCCNVIQMHGDKADAARTKPIRATTTQASNGTLVRWRTLVKFADAKLYQSLNKQKISKWHDTEMSNSSENWFRIWGYVKGSATIQPNNKESNNNVDRVEYNWILAWILRIGLILQFNQIFHLYCYILSHLIFHAWTISCFSRLHAWNMLGLICIALLNIQ